MNHIDFRSHLDRAFAARAAELEHVLVADLKTLPQAKLRSTASSVVNRDATKTGDESTSNQPSELLDPILTAAHRVEINGREFWFSGNAVLCRCPDCAAPMTVRLWLGLADCWRCRCSIQLDQIELARLRPVISQPQQSPRPTALVPSPTRSAFSKSREFDSPTIPVDVGLNSDWRAAELERLLSGSRLATLVRDLFQSLPAWLVSFLFHLALLLILAMIVLQQTRPDGISIVLSTFLSKDRTTGGEVRIENPKNELMDDSLPLPDISESDTEARELERAAADARELLEDPIPLTPLPDLDDIRRNITTDRGLYPSFAARDPRVRAEIVTKNGGTTLTEAAVARGLRWLASVQNEDGSWSLANYDRHTNPENPGDAAATGLALLPFLGAGQTQERGIYRTTVSKGIAWLLQRQKKDGDLRADFPGQAGMYAHGQAAIVLCEAYAITGDEKLRGPAQRAIDFIEKAQHRRGGWRYEPGQPGDTSVFGWQLMALQSARAASGGLRVTDSTIELADYFLDSASTTERGSRIPSGALYRYLPDGGDFSAAMTAEGILCRMYLGWQRDDPRIMTAVRWLSERYLPSEDDANIYYWYYGTQVMHHYGGREWDKWNRAVRDLLVDMQVRTGRYPGSWNPKEFEWGAQGERIFVTSLAVCTLEVYYRHLPLFQKIDLDE